MDRIEALVGDLDHDAAAGGDGIWRHVKNPIMSSANVSEALE